MNRIRTSLMVLAGLLWLSSCSTANGEMIITETSLTENEKLLFSTVSKDTYLFDLDGQFPKHKQIKIGVDYYHFGEFQEGIEITSLETNSKESSNYNQMTIMLLEEESGVHGDFDLSMEDGGGIRSAFNIGELDTEDKSFSSGVFLENEELVISDSSNEKQYLALYLITPSSEFRTFDLRHALEANDDYETLYLFYVQVLDLKGE